MKKYLELSGKNLFYKDILYQVIMNNYIHNYIMNYVNIIYIIGNELLYMIYINIIFLLWNNNILKIQKKICWNIINKKILNVYIITYCIFQ